MSLLARSSLPNAITIGRIILAPAIFFLICAPSYGARLLSFVLFLVAAVSDLWDGYLARKYGWISNFGKLVDPIADKLLLVATFVPIYVLSHRHWPGAEFPVWGELPLWVVLVIFGREVLITAIRSYAARRGVVIPAGPAGKRKAVWQNIFIGAALLWFALHTAAMQRGWSGAFWRFWQVLHGTVVSVTLAVALVLTLYSLGIYLWSWRSLVRETP